MRCWQDALHLCGSSSAQAGSWPKVMAKLGPMLMPGQVILAGVYNDYSKHTKSFLVEGLVNGDPFFTRTH